MRISDWSSDVCSSDLEHACHSSFRSPGAASIHNGGRRSERNARVARRAGLGFSTPSVPIGSGDGQRKSCGMRGLLVTAMLVVAVLGSSGSQARAGAIGDAVVAAGGRSEEHTSELQSLMRISYAVFCLKKKNK